MKYKVLLIILLIFGFVWRFIPLAENHSFWTDEDHVAIFSKAVLEKGKPVLANGFNIGIYQLPMYWLGALGMKVFGQNEIAIRWSSLGFGVLSILAVYLLSKKLFSEKVGLLAAFLTAFLNIEILWSIQARPYQTIQFFWLLGTYFSFRYFEWRQKKFLLLAVVCGLLAEFFHPLGSLFLVSQLIIYFVLTIFRQDKKNYILPVFVFLLANIPLLYFISPFEKLKNIFSFNNFFYYRVFLFNNYLPLVLFAFICIFFLIKGKQFEKLCFLLIPFVIQLFIVSFVADVPFIRYFYPVFGFLIILASYGVWETGYWIQKNIKYKIFPILNIKYKILNILYSIFSFQYSISVLLILLMVFSLWKTNKLSLSPRKVYSLNSDMQEIPEVDWKKLYFFVEEKLKLSPDTILVASWMDTPVWFLGEGKLNFLLRKSELEIDSLSGARYINSPDKFLSLIKEKPAGILVLDSWDTAVPEGVREYCHKNLEREMEIDRLYPTQSRYWTVWVYSWGMN